MTEEAARHPSSDDRSDELLKAARAAVAPQRRDPVVTVLTVLIIGIVIIALSTVLYGMLTGVFGNGTPRTYSEARIQDAKAKLDGGSKGPVDWDNYILALTDAGQYGLAQEWIDKGKKTLKDQDISQDMVYMQANLYFATGKLDETLKTADAGMKQIKTRYEEGKKKYQESGNPDMAFSTGLNDNYYEMLLLKAAVYEKRNDLNSAIKAYDEYLGGKPISANIFVQRGDLKAKVGDKKGAEADYRQALVYMPNDKKSLEGLKRIGVTK